MRWENALLSAKLGDSPPECGYSRAFSRICRFDYRAKNGRYSCIYRCFTLLTIWTSVYTFIFLALLISLALGSLSFERFRRDSMNRWIQCANQTIHWTTWSNSLPYMTQVIKAFTLIFFQAFLLQINKSSTRLVTSVLNYTIFANI